METNYRPTVVFNITSKPVSEVIWTIIITRRNLLPLKC